MSDTTTLPPCNWPMDDQGFVNLRDMPADVVPCRIPPGFRGWVSQVALQHADGSPADSDYSAKPARKARKKMEPKHEEAPAAPAAEHTATVAIPAMEGLPDLKALIPADGKITGASVAMALVAVAGSGAVIKMVKSWLDKRAEQKDAELELKKAEQEQKRDDHGQCNAAREALAAEVRASVEAAKAAAQATNDQITDAVTQLSERVEIVEKVVFPPKAKAKAKPKAKAPKKS